MIGFKSIKGVAITFGFFMRGATVYHRAVIAPTGGLLQIFRQTPGERLDEFLRRVASITRRVLVAADCRLIVRDEWPFNTPSSIKIFLFDGSRIAPPLRATISEFHPVWKRVEKRLEEDDMNLRRMP